MIYVYAIVAGARRTPGVRGFGRARVRVVRAGGVTAAVATLARGPAPTPSAFRTHDRVVRALARSADAVLPVRFGSTMADASALAQVLRVRARALRPALGLVRGREQMTLRVFSAAAAARTPAPRGSGARYLTARRRTARVAELDPLRRALGGLVRAERVERHRAAPLLASVHHLIPRGRDAAHRAAIARAAAHLPALAVRASGPWAPYAFAPDGVA